MKKIITVVIPIHNTEKYISETIECVCNQSIGIEKIEMLLVDDGSIDSSGKICVSYADKYPESVQYIRLPQNMGVSNARNIGLDRATGKYITFLDSDDLWSLNAFEEAVAFLDDNSEKIDAISANIQMFENEVGRHGLNINSDDSIIVDMYKDYYMIRSIGPTFIFRTDVARMYRFDCDIKAWEDTIYAYKILLEKQCYGFISGITYYYRKRSSKDSATNKRYGDMSYYFHDFKRFMDILIDLYNKRYGKLNPMIQYLMVYYLYCRYQEDHSCLEELQCVEYEKLISYYLGYVDDKYILDYRLAPFQEKYRMLAMKSGLDVSKDIDEYKKLRGQLHNANIRAARNKANLDILKKWFEACRREGEVDKYLHAFNWSRVAIYGMSDIGILLLNELEKCDNIQVCYGIDKRADKLVSSVKIYTPEDDLPGDVDVIIITAVYFYDDIVSMLGNKVNCPIISIEDIINYM